MESAPSRGLLGVAEENVEVYDDINEIEAVIGIPKAPNKDTNTGGGWCGVGWCKVIFYFEGF